jgi:hypothetical protein
MKKGQLYANGNQLVIIEEILPEGIETTHLAGRRIDQWWFTRAEFRQRYPVRINWRRIVREGGK